MGRFIKYRLFIIVAALLLLGGCYDSFESNGRGSTEGESTSSVEIPTPNITVKQLSKLLETDMMLIYDDMIVRGSVTSTDRNGNFYKTFVVEDDGYGVEILEGLYDSYVRHDVGSVVSIKLKGLAMSRYRGVLQVGLESVAGSYYTLDYLTAEPLIDEHIFNSYTYSVVEPHVVDYEELSEEMCGRLIRLDSLRHIPSEDQLQPYTWGSYQQFINNYGDSLYCYTSEYANFSLLSIPQGVVSLCGILQWAEISGVSGGEQYILEMRGVEDCISE